MKSVILTNEQGKSLGKAEIIEAHKSGGKLHKAFSVCIVTPDKSKILLQRRASGKMLFPGLWANTCCSHPQEKRPIEEEAATRLMEECGFTTGLTAIGSFVYRADDPRGTGTEYENDTVLKGTIDESTKLNPNPEEIMEMKWAAIAEVQKDMHDNPKEYAPWFGRVLELVSTAE